MNNDLYAALVTPDGIAHQLTLPTGGIIFSTAINSSGLGLIGGNQNMSADAYAAYVAPDGSVSPISSTPTGGAQISSVSLNSSGTGIIGGQTNNDAYAAYVTPAGILTVLVVPTGGANIASVSINESGNGIIGGFQNNVIMTDGYAALVSPAGITALLNVPTGGAQIDSVSINSQGVALIGGSQNNNIDAYAALVSPTGGLKLLNVPTHGNITSVAINEFGAGLIGGNQSNNNDAYAALVLPDGSLRILSVPIGGANVASVALLSQIPTAGLTGNNSAFANYINKNAPQDALYFVPAYYDGTLSQALESAAPTRNAISLYTANNNVFYLNHSLSNHLRNAYHYRNRTTNGYEIALNQGSWSSEDGLLASMSNMRMANTAEQPCCYSNDRPYTIWFDAIGALSYQKAQKQTAGFDPATAAFLVGFDATLSQRLWVGGGAAYSYTHVHEREGAGHSNINQEYLFAYTTYDAPDYYVDGALWGGYFQIDQVRHIKMTGFDFKSKSHPHGWQLAPHLEIGYHPIKNESWMMDPFVMLDWVSAWQSSFKEKGSSPFNAGQKHHYSSLLRTEAGLRFYETLYFDNWRLTFEEKGSYVNKQPFHVGRVNAFLIGSPGSFNVETLTTAQNLGAAELSLIFEPVDESYPYGTISYQGEFGVTYQSHQICLEVAWNF